MLLTTNEQNQSRSLTGHQPPQADYNFEYNQTLPNLNIPNMLASSNKGQDNCGKMSGEGPKFAIVKMTAPDDVVKLFQLLIDNGYGEVSFVNGLDDPSSFPWALAQALSHHADALKPCESKDDSGDDSAESGSSEGPNSEGTTSAESKSQSNSPQMDSTSETESFANCALAFKSHERDPKFSVITSTVSEPEKRMETDSSGQESYGSRSVAPTPPYKFSSTESEASLSLPKTPDQQDSGWSSAFSSGDFKPAIFPPQTAPFFAPARALMAGGPHLKSLHSGPHLDRPPPTHFQGGLSALTTPATTQLRQRGSRAQTDDPNAYVSCRLCHNKIMASRLSNLTNHVRRHSTLKQFQCCYCEYTHNEMAKVRLHMLHNHKDRDSQPIDNISPEMQTAWDLLMQKCFPEHYSGPNGNDDTLKKAQSTERLELPAVVRPSPSPVGGRFTPVQRRLSDPSMCSIANKSANQHPFMTQLYNDFLMGRNLRQCQECGETVPAAGRVQHIKQTHIKHKAFVCSACGLEDDDRWNVIKHISACHDDNSGHPDRACPQVFTRDMDSVIEALLPKYFPPPASVALRQAHSDQTLNLSSDWESTVEEKYNKMVPAAAPYSHSGKGGVSDSGIKKVNECSSMPILPPNLDEHIIPGTENLRCLQCFKVLDGVRPLSSLLSHAKRHYHVKQYQCPLCPYSSFENVHVRNHLKLKHNLPHQQPLDNRSPALQVAWMQTMIRCFPAVAPRLNRFRFKNFRSKPTGRPKKRHNNNNDETDVSSQDSRDNRGKRTDHKKRRSEGQEEDHMKREGSNSSFDSNQQPSSSSEDGSCNGADEKKDKRQCRLCGKYISTQRQFLHATTHIPIKPYGCSICQYRSSDYQQLRAHMWKHKLIGVEKQKARITTCDVPALRSEYVNFCFEN